ncbi:MAG TPA: DUF1538 domain-containing protein [Alphaproteobacteria bacterium]|nr:DUF1538 domain-containing protein [Alphaproteobacteria bacterium]HJN61271.1 DUF1538 domain-containing protein [Alphaproteobacteria bacterium]
MGIIDNIVSVILDTLLHLAPLVGLILFFQIVVIRKKLANWRRVAIGFVYVVVGLSLFLIGLQTALFPLGETMARQLTDPEFLGLTRGVAGAWYDYFWVYIFAAAIGLGTTIAEPALIAVADKAGSVSGGTINPWGLRIAVAIGVSVGVTLGTFRIVTGIPLFWFIMAGYAIVIVQTLFASRSIIPLAYDSGGVTTSTVTLPLVVALGLGLAANVQGRSLLIDGFGLIALASVFPIIAVLGYAQLTARLTRKRKPGDSTERT